MTAIASMMKNKELNKRYGYGFALSSIPFFGTILVSPVKPSKEAKRTFLLPSSL